MNEKMLNEKALNEQEFEELDGFDQELREALAPATPEPDPRMCQALAAFREKLDTHPHVRRLERRRRRDWVFRLRQFFRYALAAGLAVILCASLTAGGRQAVFGRLGGVLDSLLRGLRVRVDAALITNEERQQEIWREAIMPERANLQQVLGVTPDLKQALLFVARNETAIDQSSLRDKAKNRALWAVALATGKVTPLCADGVASVQALPEGDPLRRLSAVAYVTRNTGMWTVCKSAFTAELANHTLWLWRPGRPSRSFAVGSDGKYAFSPDLKRFFYQPYLNSNYTTIYDIETGVAQRLKRYVSKPVAWSPDGREIIALPLDFTLDCQGMKQMERISTRDGELLGSRPCLPGRSPSRLGLLAGTSDTLVVNSVNSRQAFLARMRSVSLEPSCFRFDFLGLGGPARFPEALAHKLDTASDITTLACSPDGQYLAQFDMNHPKVFQARSGKVVQAYSWMLAGALWAPDSRRFVAVGRPRDAEGRLGEFTCALFDVETGTCREFPVNDTAGKSLVNGFLKPVAWLDGDRVAWVGRGLGTGEVPLQLVITNVKTGASQAFKLHL